MKIRVLTIITILILIFSQISCNILEVDNSQFMSLDSFITFTNSANKSTRHKEKIDKLKDIKVVLVNYERKAFTEPGYDEVIVQVAIQNHSKDLWINMTTARSVLSKMKITTKEGFEYSNAYNMIYLGENDQILEAPGVFGPAAYTALPILPPGFQTLTTQISWKISNQTTEPIFSFTLNTSEGEKDYKLQLSNDNIVPYLHTPFIGNITWDMYKQEYGNVLNTLDIGDIKKFDFGTIKFNGFKYSNNINEKYPDQYKYFLDMDIENASIGYEVGFNWELDGLFVDSGVGFSKGLTYPIGITSINPGQTKRFGWDIYYTEEVSPYEVYNLQNNYPETIYQLKNPICVIIPHFTWTREDVGRGVETQTNIIACQE